MSKRDADPTIIKQMRMFARWIGLFCALASVAAARPNILFCLADDWGWPHAGAYGDFAVKTPTFDRLAEEGVLFDHAYVSVPSCTPCRNAILTGQQFYRLGQGGNLCGPLDMEHPNFMFLLRDAGYEIGHWRKAWGPGNPAKGGYTEHPCGTGYSFEDFMKNRDDGKPFCFWFGTSDPHRPYEAGTGIRNGIDLDSIRVPGFLPDNETVRSDIADYYFEVQRWDRDVGVALKLLEEQGVLDNTIVVMTGDHGMPFPRCKGNLYDSGTRVPLAIRWGDRVEPGHRTDFVSLSDLAPTFLHAAGLDVPKEMTGKDLFDSSIDRCFVVTGRERHVPAQERPSLEGYPSRALRTGKWLLILNLEPDRWPAGAPVEPTCTFIDRFADCDTGPTKSIIIQREPGSSYDLCFAKRGAVELYDCENDPEQLHNLADDPAYTGVVKTLRLQLISRLKKTGDPRFTNAPVLFDTLPFSFD